MDSLPPLSVDLIKQLDQQYPSVSPSTDISDRELWGRIYQRRLIDSLMVSYSISKEHTYHIGKESEDD